MIKILSVGDENCTFFNEYSKRIYWKLEVKTFKSTKFKFYKENISPGDNLYLLDFRGEQFTSESFAFFLDKQQKLFKNLVFIVGGAAGIPDEIYQLPHKKISLGLMTWPHILVRVLLIEQIYRAQQILSGHPYHK